MTVAELVDLLEAAPRDAIVQSAGCDCVEDAVGISIQGRGSHFEHPDHVVVVIERDAGDLEGVLTPKPGPRKRAEPRMPLPRP